MPGEGDPEAVRPVRQPVHGGRLRGFLHDGRRPRWRRSLQHHAAGGLRARHGPGQGGPSDHRRPHRPAVRARPPGHHRDQRRLRAHQASAAVPVLAAAFADLQGHLLQPEQAQQRREHVHQRQLRRQHRDQGPRRPRPVRFRASARGASPSSRCPPSDTPTSTATRSRAPTTCGALFDAIINDDPLPEEKNADNTPVPETPTAAVAPGPTAVAANEIVDAVTTTRATSPSGSPTRPARTVWRRPRPTSCRTTASTSTTPTTTRARWTRRPCSSPRATSRRPRPSASSFANADHRAGLRHGRRHPGGARVGLPRRERAVAEWFGGAGARHARTAAVDRPTCRRT